jgi:hypothetical protein
MVVQSDWLPLATHPALPAYHIELAQEELPHACGNAPALALHGCAVRIPEAMACLIYTTPQPPDWVLEHERRHCAGWDHR